MKSISIGSLRQNPTEMIRDVQAGNAYMLTNHGRPVADIVPHRDGPWVPAAVAAEVLAAGPVDVAWGDAVDELRDASSSSDPWRPQ